MPPASSRPTIASSSTATSANRMRNTVAAAMPTRMARARRSGGRPGGGKADDHGIVAGQHQVDHDHLEKAAIAS